MLGLGVFDHKSKLPSLYLPRKLRENILCRTKCMQKDISAQGL